VQTAQPKRKEWQMAKVSLRSTSVSCLGIWAAIWLMFLMMRFSPLDIRVIPGIGPIMLMALIIALVAPIVATGISGAALVRQPRLALNWLTFGCAIAVLVGQWILFTITSWL
jgi:hypothetical protein